MLNFLRTTVLLAALTALFMGVGYLVGGQSGMLIAFVVAALTNLFAYWNSDKMVLRMQGARAVDPHQQPDLYRTVEALSQRAGIPTPKIYVIAISSRAKWRR
jgi:heat shock protein HtpX